MGSVTIMSQARDGGMGGLKNCLAERVQCGYSLSIFYLLWLPSFGTKKLLVVVRRYYRALRQDERQGGLSTECHLQTPLSSLDRSLHSMSTLRFHVCKF